MAFAVTAFRAYGIYIDEPITSKCEQVYEITYTRGAADVDADIFEAGATFWTDAGGTTLGGEALAAMSSILPRVERLAACELQGNAEYMLRAAAAGASAYVLSTPATPTITHANDGTNTTIKAYFRFTLKIEERAVRAGF
jgi:hypothetical protein